MIYITVEIKKYRCALFSSNDNPAKVSLYDVSNKEVATAYFRPEEGDLPQTHKDSRGKFRMYFRRSYLFDLIDLLRNEKPIYVHFWNKSGNNFNTHIATTKEPIGEDED